MNSYIPLEDVERRTNELLTQMTLEEKIEYIGGCNMFLKEFKRLGIPAIKLSDGPMGCRCFGKATAFPAGIGLASTWNRELSCKIGTALGRECRARGVHILLAPGVNIYRSPKCGRNFEYMGEDPFLASEMVVPQIDGIQSEGVLATIKHFACNNQEWDRHHVSSEVDERAFREIYIPAFEAAIRRADARCLMTSYNLVNGIHASENEYLINQIVKSEWEFDGIVMSDWESVYDAVNPANAGLDLEMPEGRFMNKENLIPAIKDGRVKESTIDDKVRRLLRTFIAAGFFDRPQLREDIPVDDPTSSAVSLEVAREALVLLKNENNTLPLERANLKSVMVLGPNSHSAIIGAGGSSFTDTFHSTSIIEGMRKIAGESVEVRTVPRSLGFEGSLKMEVFSNRNHEGLPVHTSQVDEIYDNWVNVAPDGIKGGEYSVRWTGKICPLSAAKYELSITAQESARIFIDGKQVQDNWKTTSKYSESAIVDLENREYDICIEVGLAIYARFSWNLYQSPSEFAKYFKDEEAIIYCAGYDLTSEAESYDRPFELLDNQAVEIKALAEVNPRVIVVLNSGGGVDWSGWLDGVAAVIEAWYPGQDGGLAVAETIFGDVNPSGKLPVSFEKHYEDNPSAPYYDVNDNGKTPYGESIFVGYRGYDKNNIEPQFCFGHGLSYTTFDFADLRIAEKGNGDSREIKISCSITNSGRRVGAEVAQLYVGDVECRVERPVRELKGFNKVILQPGETKIVSFTLANKDLAFYDVDARAWVADPGEFNIWIGSSSRQLPLHGKFVW